MTDRPVMQHRAGGYDFVWAKEQVGISVRRVIISSKGEITGEITITNSAPGVDASHLHQARFNFSSTMTRSSLTKLLKERCPDIDWYAILEQLSKMTLDALRKGEPVKMLCSGDDVVKPTYALFPFVLENHPNILFGERSAAKTTVAIIMTQIMAIQWDDNPLKLTPPTRKITCLLLDWEQDSHVVTWQLKRMENGMNEQFNLMYRRCSTPLAQDIDQIRQHIDDTGAEVVLIDSLGPACGGELKEAAPALAFYAALRSLNVTSIILAHTAKGQGEPGTVKTVFGSMFFEAEARNIWEVKKAQSADDDKISVGLFHRKPPPFDRIQNPFGLEITFTENSMEVVPQEPKTVEEFMDLLGAPFKIKAILRDGEKTNIELTRETGLKAGTLRSALKRLKDKGEIQMVLGKWRLLAHDYDE